MSFLGSLLNILGGLLLSHAYVHTLPFSPSLPLH